MFPSGHGIVFGHYFARNDDNTAADPDLPDALDVFRLQHRNAFALTGKISRTTFVENEARVLGTIGSKIPFSVFLIDPVSSQPLALDIYSKIECVFCNKEGTTLVFTVALDGGARAGVLNVVVPASISMFLDVNNSAFDIRLYIDDNIDSVASFRGAISLVNPIC